jgi:hypothetical protein
MNSLPSQLSQTLLFPSQQNRFSAPRAPRAALTKIYQMSSDSKSALRAWRL